MYWNKNIFRLYANFINAGIVTDYIRPIAINNYHLYTKAFNLNYTDNELDMIFHIAQAIEQRFINLTVKQESPIGFDEAVELILRAPLLYMGVSNKDIQNILKQSIINVNNISYTTISEIAMGLIVEH